MKHLEAPWRSEYVTGASGGEGCVLCRIAEEGKDDRENLVLFRQGGLYVVLNRYPYINGHLMIVPEDHLPDFSSLGSRRLDTLTRLIVKCERALAEGMECMGINGGWNMGSCAGAGVEGHIHLHMLPRWSGDTNFMTTTCNTRVISASLEDSYARLKPFFTGKDEN